jgi:hypothetical protein
MPELSRFYGISISMQYNEHNPPHFHVKYGEYRATVTIQDGIVDGSLPRRALNMVFEWLDIHQDELLDNWQRIENKIPLKTISPLQ